MSLWSLLHDAEHRSGGRPAVRDGTLAWTYAELAAHARGLAAWLADRGVGPGERVAVLARNRAEYLAAYFAAAGLAAILVPLNCRLATAELAAIWRRLEDEPGRVPLLAERRFAGAVDALRAAGAAAGAVRWLDDGLDAAAVGAFAPRPAAADAVAQLYFTSGTTGEPKGVMLTHGNVAAHAAMATAELDLHAGDVWAHVAPMFHLADAWAVFAITAVGGTHVVQRDFEAAATLELLESEGITITNLVPTMLNLMVKHEDLPARDLSRMRLVLSGGAPIAAAVVHAIDAAFGGDYVQTYGLTETSPFLTMSLLDERQRALPAAERLRLRTRTGRPVRGVALRVLRDDGGEVARDDREVGEIVARGPTVTPGYWRDPAATAAAFTAGWLRTGDLATVDAGGSVRIVDRKKDVIITGGENVYTTEVEHRLYQHPAVLEAAVYGAADDTWGEVVAAAVVLRPGAVPDAAALQAFCCEALAAYKAPRIVRFVGELPRTGSGKICKRLL